ncbi:MAG: pyruvate kinase [Dehalococcoidia bacterium]
MPTEYKLPDFILARPRTRIVCTIGPATGSPERMLALVRAGMSVARLNLTHGTREDHKSYVSTAREVAKQAGVDVGILADLPGPKYRLGEVSRDGIVLNAGDPFVLTADTVKATEERATVWPAGLHVDVPAGSKVLIDEGAVELRVDHVSGVEIRCTVEVGGLLQPRKAVTAPGNTSTLDYFTDETVEALDFASEADVDFVGLSYIRNVDDLRRVKSYLAERGRNPLLVSKIELREAVNNLDSIVDESYGVMVARGDLGVELPLAEVPGVQRRIVFAANSKGKPVITATEMLESMIESPHPTRAEATDVHNAVRDGTDAIMLSGETSIGKHPVRAVEYMADIALRAEEEMDYEFLMQRRHEALIRSGQAVDDAIAYSACRTAATLGAKVILAFTESGSTAARVASFRPRTPIIALMRERSAARIALRWGIIPVRVPGFESVQQMFYEGSRAAVDAGFAQDGDLAVAVVGMPIGIPGNTNLLRVIKVPEPQPKQVK